MTLPCGPSGPRLRRALAFALVALTLLIESGQPEAFGPPNDPVADVATLERIAAITAPNAAILAHTNPFFFARVLRRDADRVWVPLRLDVHQTAIALGHLAPVRRDASRGGWIEKPISRSDPGSRPRPSRRSRRCAAPAGRSISPSRRAAPSASCAS